MTAFFNNRNISQAQYLFHAHSALVQVFTAHRKKFFTLRSIHTCIYEILLHTGTKDVQTITLNTVSVHNRFQPDAAV